MMEEIDAPMTGGGQLDLAAERDGRTRRGPTDLEPRLDRFRGLGQAQVEAVLAGDEVKAGGFRDLRLAVDPALDRSLDWGRTRHVDREADDPLGRCPVADEERGRKDIEPGLFHGS